MKLLLLLLFAFSLCSSTVFSQINQTGRGSPVDSVKPNPSKPIPLKYADVAAGMQKTNDITDNLAQSKNLRKFYTALQAAGLSETFKSKGPITIFVPDDNAFSKLPQAEMDSLKNPAFKLQLIAVVSYHAIAGKFTSKDIAHQINPKTNFATFTTLSGDTLTARIDANRNIVLTDEDGHQCTVTHFDVEQSNGMLFLINGVLIPKKRLL